jgi:hypothetical protein
MRDNVEPEIHLPILLEGLTNRVVLVPTGQQRSQGLVNVAPMPYVINVDARFFFIDPVDYAISPNAIGVVTVQFPCQFCTYLRVI